ncbi:hypothetical protein SAMN05444349_14128 [Bacteroides faecichinchillae]|uniref:Uncharacterized protein n=1 Tax=Bacteroides faecichinchillae TaxID=871325 RepID=A0A1M5F6T9_9BACE|nr:hypothetical protein [Bacteroides faecichinchillae]SHF86772.1 hypothetical protein SAMN05444349_14128 [Bacteroides faecichinchillae]
MAKEGELMQFVRGLKINEVVELPNNVYDSIMNATRYRARRKHNIVIERVGDINYEKGTFKIKRVE